MSKEDFITLLKDNGLTLKAFIENIAKESITYKSAKNWSTVPTWAILIFEMHLEIVRQNEIIEQSLHNKIDEEDYSKLLDKASKYDEILDITKK